MLIKLYDGKDGTNLLPKMRWKKVIQNGDGQETVRSVQIRFPPHVHCLVHHGEGIYSEGKGNYINGLEGFWGYLKRKLALKGGISRRKMPLYLVEYVRRYKHRTDMERLECGGSSSYWN